MSQETGDYYLRRNLDRLPSGRSGLPWLMVYRPFEYACQSWPDSGMLVATMSHTQRDQDYLVVEHETWPSMAEKIHRRFLRGHL
jgi:hypothetical protein